jgi:hypothetical protein
MAAPLRALALLSLAAAALASEPCYDQLDGTRPFETVCYKLLANLSNGLSLREYANEDAAANLVVFSAASTLQPYSTALNTTTGIMLLYFTGPGNELQLPLVKELTVPLLLRPPSAAHDQWQTIMAIAPSSVPAGSAPVGVNSALDPGEQCTLQLLAGGADSLTIAVQRAVLKTPPVQGDFTKLCAKLQLHLKTSLPGWHVDPQSQFTPSHAHYYGQAYKGPSFVIECWMGVVAV